MELSGSLEIGRETPNGPYRVTLNGHDISRVLAADGVRIEWEKGHPRVYLKLGLLDLNATLPADAAAVVESLPRAEAGR